MNIGEAARRSGLPAKTIRYYEDIGLIRVDRQNNGYRDYTIADLEQLTFLKQSRAFGFSLDECRTLLELYANPGRASADVKELTARHLQDLELKAAELRHLAETLRKLVRLCAGDGGACCPIIDALADASSSASSQEKSRPQSSRSHRKKDEH